MLAKGSRAASAVAALEEAMEPKFLRELGAIGDCRPPW